MNEKWQCLILMFVGAMLAEVCFNITYIYAFFGADLENIPNRIVSGLHLLGVVLAIMGMFDMVKTVEKQGGYKPRVQVDVSYFTALKREILHVLKKLKDVMKV